MVFKGAYNSTFGARHWEVGVAAAASAADADPEPWLKTAGHIVSSLAASWGRAKPFAPSEAKWIFCFLGRLFLNSVISAIIGLFLTLLIAFYVFVEFFLNPMRLRTDQHFEGTGLPSVYEQLHCGRVSPLSFWAREHCAEGLWQVNRTHWVQGKLDVIPSQFLAASSDLRAAWFDAQRSSMCLEPVLLVFHILYSYVWLGQSSGSLILSATHEFCFHSLICSSIFLGLKNQTDVWFVFLPAAPVETRAAAILASAGLVILLGLLTLFLLGHLLIFHIYLSRHHFLLCTGAQVNWPFPFLYKHSSTHPRSSINSRCPLGCRWNQKLSDL